MEDFAADFKKRFKREPTREDLREVTSRLPLDGSAEGKDNFNKALDDMRVAGNLSADDVSDIIAKMASETKAQRDREDAEREERRLARKSTRRFIVSSLCIGLALGVGVASFVAAKDRLVEAMRSGYEARLAALDGEYAEKALNLQKKFFGPLDSLSSSGPKSKLTTLERQLYVSACMGEDFGDKAMSDRSDVICDKLVGDVQVVGKVFTITHGSGRSTSSQTYLMVEKREPTGAPIAVFVYTVGTERPDQAVQSPSPMMAVEFSDAQVKFIDFKEKAFRQVEGNRTVYQSGGGENFGAYEKLGADVANDFRSLFGRGPNQAPVEAPK